mmetsp:Transcript_23038/g.65423  ORF Transcript_23038/g.65423 Transcript_23038/m.65423 type:complete len:222 (-) Transcript_23038:1520-2185(-)
MSSPASPATTPRSAPATATATTATARAFSAGAAPSAKTSSSAASSPRPCRRACSSLRFSSSSCTFASRALSGPRPPSTSLPPWRTATHPPPPRTPCAALRRSQPPSRPPRRSPRTVAGRTLAPISSLTPSASAPKTRTTTRSCSFAPRACPRLPPARMTLSPWTPHATRRPAWPRRASTARSICSSRALSSWRSPTRTAASACAPSRRSTLRRSTACSSRA